MLKTKHDTHRVYFCLYHKSHVPKKKRILKFLHMKTNCMYFTKASRPIRFTKRPLFKISSSKGNLNGWFSLLVCVPTTSMKNIIQCRSTQSKPLWLFLAKSLYHCHDNHSKLWKLIAA